MKKISLLILAISIVGLQGFKKAPHPAPSAKIKKWTSLFDGKSLNGWHSFNKKGEVKNRRDARALARFFLNTVKGLQVTGKSSPDKSVFDDIIMLAVSTLDQNN